MGDKAASLERHCNAAGSDVTVYASASGSTTKEALTAVVHRLRETCQREHIKPQDIGLLGD